MNLLATIAQSIINAYPNALAIYLYGSYAQGTHTADSDVDICVLMPIGEVVNRYNFVLNNSISKLVGKEVHCVFCTKQNGWCKKLIWEMQTK
jgi:predicted nucleotidyltransferase